MKESENTEFKETYTPEIYKEVVAFVNTDGGTVYIGIDDSGNETGLENIDEIYTQITNGIRDSINPDVTMFIKYHLQSNNIIKIEISEGTDKPYYLKSKGIKPSGVYVRQGTRSTQASYEQIRKMIKLSDADVFEKARSINQELTFSALEKEFRDSGLDIKYNSLGLRDMKTNEYTNLAGIISDQCPYTVKIAVFSDSENTVFRDRKEFGGSVFEQYHKTADYLSVCNRISSDITGFKRNDNYDYPVAALRECLLNALIHRDYSYSGSIIININESCIEFISLGNLVEGLSKEDIISGVSLCRNEKLAEIFRKTGYVEAYGTGIRRIYSLYHNCSVTPEIIITPNAFKIILPNMNAANSPNRSDLSEHEIKVLSELKIKKEMTPLQLEELLNLKKTKTYMITRHLEELGYIISKGRGKTKVYRINE